MHPVEQKLRTIARYTVSAQKIKSHPRYMIFEVYSWANDVIAALAGIGITFAFLPPAKEVSIANTPLSPFAFGLAGGVLGVLWALLKLAATREDGIKRATLMKSCNQQMMVQRGHIYDALEKSNPLEELSDVYQELYRTYDRSIQDGSWPWLGDFAPNIEPQINRDANQWFSRWNQNFGSATSIDPENLRSDP